MQDSGWENTYAGAGCQWGLSEEVEHSYILDFISGQKHSFQRTPTASGINSSPWSQGFCLISRHFHWANYLYDKLAWEPELSYEVSSPRAPISVLISGFTPQFHFLYCGSTLSWKAAP